MADRKLKIPRQKLIELAQKNLDRAKIQFDKESAEYQNKVLTSIGVGVGKIQALQDRVMKAKTNEAISKIVGNLRYGNDLFGSMSAPSKSEYCRWEHKLNWLRAGIEEYVMMDTKEYSYYTQEKC